jgi:Protein of unknown function (DUF3187)
MEHRYKYVIVNVCTSRCRGYILMILIVTLGSSGKVVADSPEWRLGGPLKVRNLSPFSLLRMDFMPPPTVASLQPGWEIEARLTHANNFVLSDNAQGFLAARSRQAPLSLHDVNTLLALNGDVLYFDGSVTSLDLGTRYVLDEHWSGFVQLPLLYYSGGFSDEAINEFHNSFGFGASGRDLVARDRYQILIRHSGDSLVLLDSPSGIRIGDPVFGIRYAGELAQDWFVVAEGTVKFPAGEVDDYVSSGAIDYGAQLSLQKQFGRQGAYLSLSNMWLGDAERFPASFRDEVPEVLLAYEFGATTHTSLVLQASWSKTAFKSGTPPLSTDEYLVSLGARHRRGSLAYDVSLTQNLVNYDNTMDVALTFGVSWSVGEHPAE